MSGSAVGTPAPHTFLQMSPLDRYPKKIIAMIVFGPSERIPYRHRERLVRLAVKVLCFTAGEMNPAVTGFRTASICVCHSQWLRRDFANQGANPASLFGGLGL